MSDVHVVAAGDLHRSAGGDGGCGVFHDGGACAEGGGAIDLKSVEGEGADGVDRKLSDPWAARPEARYYGAVGRKRGTWKVSIGGQW